MDQNRRFFVVKDRVSLAKTNGGVLGVCSTHEQQHFTIIDIYGRWENKLFSPYFDRPDYARASETEVKQEILNRSNKSDRKEYGFES